MQPCTSKDTKHATQGLCEGIKNIFLTFLSGQVATARLQQTTKIGKGWRSTPKAWLSRHSRLEKDSQQQKAYLHRGLYHVAVNSALPVFLAKS